MESSLKAYGFAIIELSATSLICRNAIALKVRMNSCSMTLPRVPMAEALIEIGLAVWPQLSTYRSVLPAAFAI